MACLLPLDAARADHVPHSFGSAHVGALATQSAVTLPMGKISLGLQMQTLGFGHFSDARLIRYAEAGEHVHGLHRLNNHSLSLAYGITDDFTLIAGFPYVSRRNQREAEHAHADDHDDELPLPLPLPLPGTGAVTHADHAHDETPVVRDLGDATGLGDLTVLGQYRWHHDTVMRRQAAWLFGFKAPTGRTDVRDSGGGRLETHHQPGSGSWDALMGTAFTRAWGIGTLDASLLYTHTGNGSQDTRLGRGISYNLGFSRRLGTRGRAEGPHAHEHAEHPHVHEAAAPAQAGDATTTLTWDLMLELNGEWHDRERQAGETVANSGGHLLYVAPGLRAGLGGWSAGLSLGAPVVKDLNGIQSEPEYRLLLSVGTSL